MANLQRYSMKQVSENDGKNGNQTWFVIKDLVYNVSSYLDEHPGGAELILEWAGRDATKAFNNVGHSSDAKRELQKYLIGELLEEEKKSNIPVKTKAAETKEKEAMNQPWKKERGFLSYVTCGCIA